MDKAGVQVLKKVHVRGAEAGVIIEVISGGDGEGDLRQLHHSGLSHTHSREQGVPDEDWGPRGRLGDREEDLGVREGEAAGPKTTAGGGLRRRRSTELLQGNVKLVWTLQADS